MATTDRKVIELPDSTMHSWDMPGRIESDVDTTVALTSTSPVGSFLVAHAGQAADSTLPPRRRARPPVPPAPGRRPAPCARGVPLEAQDGSGP
ncbi:hypothetical protein [Asanoa sp. NPDC050611]|uniref:hypothetical protein n=1 Tax=Asanoa sp. NPDC050611 TaxID=3157098 RepID=UPI00340F2E7B